ncbi:dicarboxylate/amino acid:cation symporter [Sphingobium phenoxybenzoativorans]|uniref:dicarboxylate/amino acid:cation symporter n=1 Tax=Sphingobium phenoxybenzoativorans TaxID=1592790 RepID=UPI00209B69C1|nr:cation:dicarboxylase symporter family transporter [Sphingobium phenoxybenzoativorans]
MAGSDAGFAAVATLAHYIGFIVIVCLTMTILTYPGAYLFGGVKPARFARAALPAQLIALSTQSSIATLPAMIRACDVELNVRPETRSIVLPLAISLFRLTSPAANLGVALYLAALGGMHLGIAQLAIGAAVAALVNLAAVGLPGQTTFFATTGPICLVVGVPIEALPLLLAVETIPDMFRTIGNVTADLALASVTDQTALN